MKKSPIKPEDFPVKADNQQIKTSKGEAIAVAKNEPVAENLADRLNEQAYHDEHDRWSA